MKKYKLIASDLDGTLMNSDLTVSKENYQAIKELTQQGVFVVPATGRTIAEMKDVFHIPEFRYVIYSNGAGIYDKENDKTFFFGLDDNASRFIIDTLNKFDAFAFVHKDGKTYVDKAKVNNMHKYQLNSTVSELVDDICVIEDNFDELFYNGGIENVSVFFTNKTEMDKFREIIKPNSELCSVECWDCNLEIFMKYAGKSNALKNLVKILDIEMEDVIAIGDSDNDRQMIIEAGLGLVAGNACQSLKDDADKVICTNDEHVISYVKKHYFDN